MTDTAHRPALFLDRDGTLNVERHYAHRIEDMELIPGAAQIVRKFRESGYWTVIVTNQSGIARGMFETLAFDQFNNALLAALAAEGALIDLILHCPHHPDFTGPCTCRKPNPGMIFNAAGRLPIDLSRSLMIGDRPSDVLCAQAAGVKGHLFTGSNLLDSCEQNGLLPG